MEAESDPILWVERTDPVEELETELIRINTSVALSRSFERFAGSSGGPKPEQVEKLGNLLAARETLVTWLNMPTNIRLGVDELFTDTT